MKKVIIKAVVTVVGSALLLLGVIGLFLPVLQGILFILAGLTLLSTEYHWPSKIMNKFKEKFDKAKKQQTTGKNREKAAGADNRLNKTKHKDNNENRKSKARS